MKYSQVIEIAERSAAADREVESLMMMNQAYDPEASIKQSARFMIARDKARRARDDYNEAIRLYLETPEAER